MINRSLDKVSVRNRCFPALGRILMIMKASIFLMLAFVLTINASTMAQKISLTLKDVTLDRVFEEITAQTNHRFMYHNDLVELLSTIDIDVQEATLEEVLSEVFKDLSLTYRVIAGTVVVNQSTKTIRRELNAVQQSRPITGTVTDYRGQPLEGASISVKGISGRTVITDAAGRYTITAGPNAVLVVTFVGYQPREIEVNNRNNISITLEEEIERIEEVAIVSTGYQNLDRKLFTGAATQLKASDVQRNGVPDISRMLEGQVAGVSVQNVSGTFGAAPKIRVRGATSISGENKPLWVVDGIILEDVVNVSNEALSTGDPNTLIGSSVAGLNPDDIESFNILKDAAATALYGARAMNGVIIVTTKKGRNSQGQPSFSYTSNFTTYLKPTYHDYDIMNSADQMALLIEMENKGHFNHAAASRSRNGGVFYKMYNQMYEYENGGFKLRNDLESRMDFLNRYANANTDWFDILFKNSLLQEHSVSVSSGTERSQLYASTSYLQDHGWTVVDKVQRFTGNLRGNFRINDRLSAELISNASVRDQRTPGTVGREVDAVTGRFSRDFDINPFSYALNTSRLTTAYDEDGEREFFIRNWAPFNILHELEHNTMRLTMIDFKMQGGLKYRFAEGFSYSFDGAYRYAKTDREHMIHEDSNMANAYRSANDGVIINANEYLYDNPDFPNDLPLVVLPAGGFYNTANDAIVNFYLRNTLEYDRSFTIDHKVNFFGSVEMRYTDRQGRTMEGVGYQYDRGGVPSIDPNLIKWRVEASKPYYTMQYNYDRFLAYMFRGAYSYQGKYSINGTLRYDGSNLMGDEPTARWLPTWNLSGAWNLDEETFMQNQRVFSYARFRGTYGLVGSLGAANNSSLVLMNQATRRPYLSEVETALIISGLKNRELTWEKLYETNLGLDVGLLDDRFDLTIDVYRRKIFDLIGAFRTSGIGGQFTKLANYGDMKGHGIEVTLGANITQQAPLRWRSQVNIANHVNKITNLDNNPNIWSLVRQDGGAKEGHPQRGLFSIKFDGLDPLTGIPLFINEEGERSMNVYYQSTTGTEHLVYEGPVDPTLTGGFYNQLSYKSFSLSFLFTFAAGNYVRLDPGYNILPNDMTAVTKDYYRRHIMPFDDTNIPGLIDGLTDNSAVSGYPYNAFNYSTERVAKGDFIRFKQFALNYSLPSAWVSQLGFNTATFGIIGNNIALLYSDKRLNGQDPEFFGAGGVALPLPRQFTLNVKLGF